MYAAWSRGKVASLLEMSLQKNPWICTSALFSLGHYLQTDQRRNIGFAYFGPQDMRSLRQILGMLVGVGRKLKGEMEF